MLEGVIEQSKELIVPLRDEPAHVPEPAAGLGHNRDLGIPLLAGQTEDPSGSHDTIPPAASGSPPLRPATGWITFESSAWRRIR